jgi:ElaB/YqjD/DUF883 family membrane-anchored ribosome-binding protein
MTDIATNSDRSDQAQGAAENKVVQLKHAVQQRADALGGWAQARARQIRTTAQDRPLTAAGVSAGAAFAAGIVVGLLLARAAAPPPRETWRDRVRLMTPW